MTELAPEILAAQVEQRAKLRGLSHEAENFANAFYPRRDEAIAEAARLQMSLRDIGSCVGMTPQGVSNVIVRTKEAAETLHGAIEEVADGLD